MNTYHKLALKRTSQSVLKRAALAHEILLDSKGHAGFIQQKEVSWKQLGFDAKIAEQREQFASLSKEERHAVRVIRRYKEVSRKSGRAWSKVFKAKTAKKRLPEQRSIAAHALSNQRNALAAQLLKYPEKYDLAILVENVNEDKLYEHGSKHFQKEATLKEKMVTWGALQKSLASLRLSDNPSRATNQIADWVSLNESKLKRVKGMEGKRDSLAPAARTLGLNEGRLQKEVTTLNRIQKSMQKLITKAAKPQEQSQPLTQEQRDKLNKISKMFKETKPIEGTLAERYLREHRGVKGVLPETFRFHPGIYSEGKDRPALVVIGRNEENKLRAAQLIYLDPKTANKADVKVQKRTLGIPGHDLCGVLVNQGKKGARILVAEGPETALSIREANPELRIYASLGSNNFGRVPLPNGVKEVLICADNDGGGAKDKAVLNRAKEVLTKREVDVHVIMPKSDPKLKKVDFNDVLKEGGARAVIEAMKDPKKIGAAQTDSFLINQIQREIDKLGSNDQLMQIKPDRFVKNLIQDPNRLNDFASALKDNNRIKFESLVQQMHHERSDNTHGERQRSKMPSQAGSVNVKLTQEGFRIKQHDAREKVTQASAHVDHLQGLARTKSSINNEDKSLKELAKTPIKQLDKELV